MTDNAQWVRPVRSAGCDGWDIVSEPDGSTWSHTGLHVGHLAGRASVFAGPTDVAHLPRGSRLEMTGRGPAQVAVGTAVAAAESDAVNPFRHVAVADVPDEQRGAGVASREVRGTWSTQAIDPRLPLGSTR